jgi:sugar phosphate isomerase/epimerase
MTTQPFGVNLAFAIKRWPEPAAWTRVVRDELGLDTVQFTYDLLDPWWPDDVRDRAAAAVRDAAADAGITIHSAQVGLAWYTYAGLLGAEPQLRHLARVWWERAIDVAARLGASAAGGPLGALSVTSEAQPDERQARFAEVVEVLAGLQQRAADAGLSAVLVEPTPLGREIPNTVDEARALADALSDGPVPIRFVIDNGHALLQPFYGAGASLSSWLVGLRGELGVLHLQNTDSQSDSHWGWPDSRGGEDVGQWAREVQAAGAQDVPVFLEVMHPFEWTDESVLTSMRMTVQHCRKVLSGLSATADGSGSE